VIQRREGYELDDDRDRLDIEAIWRFLRTAYWSPGVPLEVVERAVGGSLCVGLYGPAGEQAGFARAVTDAATFAWIADVYVGEKHRGSGRGRWLVEALLELPTLGNLRLTLLATADAHDLYRRYGFEPVDGQHFMELRRDPRQLYGSSAAKLTE
jgi:GNAT superfamily N-acetyltransferase